MDIELFGLSLIIDSLAGEFTLRSRDKRNSVLELLGGKALAKIFLDADDQTVILSPYGGINVTVNGEEVRRVALLAGAQINVLSDSQVEITM